MKVVNSCIYYQIYQPVKYYSFSFILLTIYTSEYVFQSFKLIGQYLLNKIQKVGVYTTSFLYFIIKKIIITVYNSIVFIVKLPVLFTKTILRIFLYIYVSCIRIYRYIINYFRNKKRTLNKQIYDMNASVYEYFNTPLFYVYTIYIENTSLTDLSQIQPENITQKAIYSTDEGSVRVDITYCEDDTGHVYIGLNKSNIKNVIEIAEEIDNTTEGSVVDANVRDVYEYEVTGEGPYIYTLFSGTTVSSAEEDV